MNKRIFLAAFGLLATSASAQTVPSYTYPAAGTPPVVPLQCDDSYANCLPITTTNPTRFAGTIAAGATDSGNPIKIGGVYTATLPTLTDGQRGNAQVSARGELLVALSSGGAAASVTTPTADGLATSGNGLLTRGVGYGFNGTTFDRLRGDVNGLVVQPGLSTTFWTYTSGTSPILSNTTTAVTIKAAAGASVRNYIDSCQITTTAFTTSVPLALRDGAGGTVIWALTVPTTGFLQPVIVTFNPPLRGTANTLWEIVTTTANTVGTVTANCSGHTGA
ncbi:MAG: hypothetical protein WCL10_18735 [Novosphingobium sp.]|uniref:hypothetical protein n=1 Tax=Novosphingobium sp. TaxID=1874826 RepID=UPI00301A29A8